MRVSSSTVNKSTRKLRVQAQVYNIKTNHNIHQAVNYGQFCHEHSPLATNKIDNDDVIEHEQKGYQAEKVTVLNKPYRGSVLYIRIKLWCESKVIRLCTELRRQTKHSDLIHVSNEG